MTENEYIQKIRNCLKISADELDDSDILTSLQNALVQISKDSPLIKSVSLSNNPDMKYVLPSDWEEGFSYIQCVEIRKEETSEYLEENKYRIIYEDGRGFLEIMDAGEIGDLPFNLYYSIPYKISITDHNVTGPLSTGLIWLSCSYAAFSLSQKYSVLRELEFDSDIKMESRSALMISISEKYKERYNDLITRIVFGSLGSGGYLDTRNHNSDIFGDNKIFH